jgi:hypothetical protein
MSACGACGALKHDTIEGGHHRMPDQQPLRPGETAPLAGYYRVHNALGSPIEQVVAMREGELLPPLPTGFTWVLMDNW